MTAALGIGGTTSQKGQRLPALKRALWDLQLSERHYAWGQNCPAVDLDFLMCEFNYGTPVALVDYKHHSAGIHNTHGATFRALNGLYNERREHLPFFIARYWPDTWSFRVRGVNEPAQDALRRHISRPDDWASLSEEQWVNGLYVMRRQALRDEDLRGIEKLEVIPPPDEPARVPTQRQTEDWFPRAAFEIKASRPIDVVRQLRTNLPADALMSVAALIAEGAA